MRFWGFDMNADVTLLSFSKILSALVHLGDRYFEIKVEMIKRGFDSISTMTSFLDGLANNEQELKLHHEILIEKAKECFANPFEIMFEIENRDDYQSPYASPLLDRLRQEREEMYSSKDALDEEEDVRLELDPCARYSLLLPFEEKKRRLAAVRDDFFRARAIEIEKKLPPPHKRLRLGNAEARSFAFDILGDAIFPLGFSPNKKISSKSATLFTKPLAKDWELCLTMRGGEWGFDQYSYEMKDGRKIMTPKSADFHLDLRKVGKRGLAIGNFDYLPLNIAEMTPLGQFQFSRYSDMDEMAIGILGYVEMYSILGGDIERVVKNVLAAQ